MTNKKSKDSKKIDAVKAVEALNKGDALTDKQRLSARNFLSWYLAQPAKGKGGIPVKVDDRQLTNMDQALCNLLKKGDSYSITTALSIAGALQTDTADSPEEKEKKKAAAKARTNEVRKAATLIRRQLQKDGLYFPALNGLVKHVAQLEVSISQLELSLEGQDSVINTVSREGATRVISHPGYRYLEKLLQDKAQAERNLLNMARKFKADSEGGRIEETPLQLMVTEIRKIQ